MMGWVGILLISLIIVWGQVISFDLVNWVIARLLPITRHAPHTSQTNRIYPLDYLQDSAGVWRVRFAAENLSEYPFSIAPIVTVTFKTPRGSRDVVFEVLEKETAVPPSSRQIFTACPQDRNAPCDATWVPHLIHASSNS
jgi:hypothetical protein